MLLAKRFVLGFESGVIVIKHWRINNYLRNDRHMPTNYQDELSRLMVDQNGAYTELDKQLPEFGIPDDSQLSTNGIPTVYTDKNSIDKNSIDKNSIDKNREERRRFTPPSFEDVKAYCEERGNKVDPQAFIDFYTSKGWKIGKETMKDWQAAVRTWERRETTATQKKPKQFVTADQYTPPNSKIDSSALERIKRDFGL
jgi:hypothetical protein